jgi:carbon-monoxide dehydrogenase large subunit
MSTTSPRRARPTRLPALAARAREDPQGRHFGRAEKHPGVSPCSPARTSRLGGLPCGWLITDTTASRMKEPPHPVPGAGQGALRRRPQSRWSWPTRTNEARDAAEADRGRLRGAAGHRRTRARRATRAPPRCTTGARQHLLRLGDRRQGGDVDAAFAKAAHVTKIDIVNNRLIPNAIEPRAAGGGVRRAPTTATRCTSPARTRTSSAC